MFLIKNSDPQKGQALVEFALLLPLLVLLIFGVLELGRAFQTKIVLENAAREGVHNLIYDAKDPANNFPNTIAAVIAESQNSGVTITSSDVTVQCLTGGTVNSPANSCPPGSTAEVIVVNDFQVSIIEIFTGPIKISSNARMLMP